MILADLSADFIQIRVTHFIFTFAYNGIVHIIILV